MEELFDMDTLESSFGGRNSTGFNYETYAKQMMEDDKKMDNFINSGCSSLHFQPSFMASEASDGGGIASSHENPPVSCKDVPKIEADMPKEMQKGCVRLRYWGVLMQDRHPIAFESRKLNDIERRYTVQEKERTAIVHCLRT
ncbi:hypothetical protein CK203_060210 [Vitis vinifera]|uniref:Reverse transcriptase RNase H-like domain-containing protein n=1 Tax=Vitis vinifera TaxID=29760 RepID=A0A438FS03_VITVI|nr:hypothetical protein CK203_060210 [Vitis vinifera]